MAIVLFSLCNSRISLIELSSLSLVCGVHILVYRTYASRLVYMYIIYLL
jgi:hypothetical protein